jgi:hypothetical protein
MRPWQHVFGLVVSIASLSVVGCAGATDSEVDDDVDLPEDFDSVSEGLTAAVDPAPAASGEHDGACLGHEGRPRHGRRPFHHLFRCLDRLDGQKDKTITIASLPARVPAGLVGKLHAIDTDHNGVVTKDEVRAAWKAHKEARKDARDDD